MPTEEDHSSGSCDEMPTEDASSFGCAACRGACDGTCPNPTWRFKPGDRVLARYTIGGDGWHAGTVHTLNYSEPGWSRGRTVPYDIRLDSLCRFDNHFVSAPYDDDSCVRALEGASFSELEEKEDTCAPRCNRGGSECALYHVCGDCVQCPKFHFCGKEGRFKTRVWKKLAARKERRDKCKKCQNGSCEPSPSPGEASSSSAGAVSATSVDGKKKRKKRKKKKKKKKRQGGVTESKEEELARMMSCTTEEEADDVNVNFDEHCENVELEHVGGDRCSRCCDCDCHEVAALGREAVVAKLQEGVDFSPLFQEDLFEDEMADDVHELAELEGFKSRLVPSDLCRPCYLEINLCEV